MSLADDENVLRANLLEYHHHLGLSYVLVLLECLSNMSLFCKGILDVFSLLLECHDNCKGQFAGLPLQHVFVLQYMLHCLFDLLLQILKSS